MSDSAYGMTVYLVIVASVFCTLFVAVKAKSWPAFIGGMFVVFFVALLIVAFVPR